MFAEKRQNLKNINRMRKIWIKSSNNNEDRKYLKKSREFDKILFQNLFLRNLNETCDRTLRNHA